MNQKTDYGNTIKQNETRQPTYDKDRADEFLFDEIRHIPKPDDDDIPEMIFVDDEPVVV